MKKVQALIAKGLSAALIMSGIVFVPLSTASAYTAEPEPTSIPVQQISDTTASNHLYRTPRKIIGTDDRTRVMDTTIEPYSSIARVEMTFKNGRMTASGTVIGKNLLLTAGHAVTDFERGAIEGYAIPGKNGNYHPFGKFKIVKSFRHQNKDIGVFVLAPNEKGQSIGDVVPIRKISLSGAVGDKITLPGYGVDKGGQMWTGGGTIIREDDTYWYYLVDTKPGNSGSPIYNQNNEIIGVHVDSVSDSNSAIKIAGPAYQFVKKHLDEDAQAAPKPAPTATPKPTATPTPKPTATATPASANDTWSAGKTYVAGDTVVYKGKTYKAKWWTKNNAPDTSSAWEQVAAKDGGGGVAYIPGKAYTGGTIVSYNGKSYKAKWWTNTRPGSDNSWTAL